MGSTNQTPMVEREQTRADQIVAMARRHAEEIRAAAEEDASRVLLEAEREAARRREERLEAEQRERTRLAIDKRQIDEALDATAAAVTRIRQLVATLPDSNTSQRMETLDEEGILAAPMQPIAASAERRRRIMNVVAVVLGVWAVLMAATLALLPRGSADAGTAPVVAAPTPASDAVTARDNSPAVAPAVVKAVTPAPAPRINVVSQPPGGELGLIVAFVAARDCWISIATDDGTSSERVLRASERYVVRARGVVSFKAGNAGALSVLINEKPTAPLGGEGRVVARRITRENYLSFLVS
jgi:hypothetical protein